MKLPNFFTRKNQTLRIRDLSLDEWGKKHKLLTAIRQGRTDEVRSLLDKGADVDAQDKSVTGLMCAVLQGNTAIVKLLLDKGANIGTRSASGWTALFAAASQGHADIVKMLLDKGANPNERDGAGGVPLIWAARRLSEN
jgi:ankyrin repeat protein